MYEELFVGVVVALFQLFTRFGKIFVCVPAEGEGCRIDSYDVGRDVFRINDHGEKGERNGDVILTVSEPNREFVKGADVSSDAGKFRKYRLHPLFVSGVHVFEGVVPHASPGW